MEATDQYGVNVSQGLLSQHKNNKRLTTSCVQTMFKKHMSSKHEG
ncbi:hypothetical protein GA0071314_2166 [Halomonas sp. HL-93]|nr:hypothetical protein GA0071314_2166 [Halomonas sp. HL-93]SNY96337.1 hypothetical protein SAMN04488142_0875 [Halomonas sp. hl-4]